MITLVFMSVLTGVYLPILFPLMVFISLVIFIHYGHQYTQRSAQMALQQVGFYIVFTSRPSSI